MSNRDRVCAEVTLKILIAWEYLVSVSGSQ